LPARHGRHGLDIVGVLGQVVRFAAVLGNLVLHVLQPLLVGHSIEFGQLWIAGRHPVMLGWRDIRKPVAKNACSTGELGVA